jgi:diguanylate cyclase (GGDEF)-like protein
MPVTNGWDIIVSLLKTEGDSVIKVLGGPALHRSRLRFMRLLDYVRAILDTLREPLVVLDEDLRVKTMNKSFCRTFQVSARETNNQCIEGLGNGQWKIPRLQVLLEEILSKNSQIQDFEVHHRFPNIGQRTMLLNARRIEIAGTSKRLILLVFEDITLRRQAELAMEKFNESLNSDSMTDDLTGLYNHRGFSAVGRHYLEIARRRGKRIFVIFVDLDGLKQINDQWGHSEGDQALIRTAKILKLTFRKSDIIARIGGDEFVIVTTEHRYDSATILMARLQGNLNRHSAQNNSLRPIALSVGVAPSDPQDAASIEELTTRADALMYVEKRSKRSSLRVVPELLAGTA